MANNFKGIYLTTSANLPNSVLQDNSLTILTDTGEVYFGSLKLTSGAFIINGSVSDTGVITFTSLNVANLISAINSNTIVIFKPSSATYPSVILSSKVSGTTYTLTGSVAINETSNITNYECMITIVDNVADGTYTAKQPGTSEPLTYDLLNDYGCFLSYNSGIVVNIPVMKNLTDLLDSLTTLDYKRLSINIKGTSTTGIFYLNSDILDIRKTLTGSTYYLYFSAKTSTNSYALSLVNLTLQTLYTWSTPTAVGSNAWYGVTYGADKFVAVGDASYITYSSDGLSWSSPVQVGNGAWLAVAYGNNRFVAVGANGGVGYTTYSSDGISWTTPTTHGSNVWRAITYNGTKFVAVGSGGYTMTSTDGITWSTPTIYGYNIWYAITYNGTKFVAVGSGGYTMTSTDGITWTTPTTHGSSDWYAITYADSKFVAVSSGGYTMTSTDGITWTTPVQVGSYTWNAITYADSKFVAVGDTGYTANYSNSTLFNTYYALSGTLATTEYIRLKIE
jgi:hypothetical protein